MPGSVIHLKLVKKDGQYKLALSDSEGREYSYISNEYKYIDPVFAHKYEKRGYSHKHVNISLIDFNKYNAGKLFAIKYNPNGYHIQRNSNGEIVKIKDQTYFTKVKLFDGNTDEEIGMLSNNFQNFKRKIFFFANYNHSYNDFLVSVSSQVEIEDMGNGSKKITFDQGNGNIGDTNRGYTDYQRIYTRETESPKEQISISKTETEVGTSHRTTSVIAQVAKEQTVMREDEMQSDQSISSQSLTRIKRASLVGEKEQAVLTNIILKIERSFDQFLKESTRQM